MSAQEDERPGEPDFEAARKDAALLAREHLGRTRSANLARCFLALDSEAAGLRERAEKLEKQVHELKQALGSNLIEASKAANLVRLRAERDEARKERDRLREALRMARFRVLDMADGDDPATGGNGDPRAYALAEAMETALTGGANDGK